MAHLFSRTRQGFLRIMFNMNSSGHGPESPRAVSLSLKLLPVLEMAFAGIYLALTRNLLVIYMTSIGFDVSQMSLMIIAAMVAPSIISIILYKHPIFLTKNVKLKLVVFHALERVFWIPMAFFRDLITIGFCYTVISTSSTIVGCLTNLLIYSSFDENGVRDVTGKRTAAFNVTSVIGSTGATILLAALTTGDKFNIIFMLGSTIGLLSTVMLLFINMEHLEGVRIPNRIKRPEQMFSISSFFLTFLTSGNLFGIFWAPYLMRVLNAPDYLAAAMNLVSTISSVFGSIAWAKRSLRTFRIALGLSVTSPLLASLIPIPTAHIGIAAFGGFMVTGAGFLGNFLFARYREYFGVVRSSIILVLLTNLSQLLATPFGFLFGQQYVLLFVSVIMLRVTSMILAFLTIPEVAMIPEDSARTYSQILYTSSLMGYGIAVETARETILLSFRFLALIFVFIFLYIIYRLVFFLAGV
ncbi:MAG: hypothetical protein NZ918_03610 [Aigarchaeota archaeon]|nr:hypothetical protein [Aigarchaeota archaeon]